MKKTLVALGLSSAFITPFTFAESAQISENKTVDESEHETLLITGNPYNQSTDEIMSTVSIINRVDIDRIQPKSVAELLQTTAGIDIATNGGHAQVTSVFVRGTNSTHTLFLVDGVRINTLTGSGGASVNDIPTYQIERIEILKGPRAAMFGSDAVGAVVQIFTRKLTAGEYQAAVEYGSNEHVFFGAAAGFSHGEGSTTLSISKEESDGYDVTDNEYPVDDDLDSYKKVNLSVNGHQTLNENLTLNWVGRYDDGEYKYDGNSIYTILEPSQKYTKHLISTGLTYINEEWSHDVTLAQYKENQKRLGDYPAEDETNRNQLDYTSIYNIENGVSYNFGGQLYQDKYKGTGSFDNKSRNTSSVFAGALYDNEALLTEMSLRYNDVENTGSKITYNASLGYQFDDLFFASINVGTGFKAPTFYQLLDQYSGNEELALETSKNLEILLRTSVVGIKTELSYFHINFENLLDFDYTTYKFANIADAEISGIELNFSKNIDDLMLSANYAYTDTEDKNTGTQLSRRARHKANIDATYHWNKFDFSAIYKFQGIRFDAFSNSSLKSYATVDLTVNYLLDDNWSLQVKANNIFDEEYETAPNYITPGAEYFLQVSYKNF